jgi:hypothetical protein
MAMSCFTVSSMGIPVIRPVLELIPAMLRHLQCCVFVALKSGGGHKSRRRIRTYRQTLAAKWTPTVK